MSRVELINNPLVSIVIPCYNKSLFLAETLDSVLAQSYENWEVVIVDDGSTDGSKDVINGYVQKDSRITSPQKLQGKKGASHCRNVGVEKAKGEYLIFLDADDILTPNCIQKRVEFMNTSSCDFGLFAMGTFYSEVGDSKYVWKIKEGDYLKMFLSHNIPWTITSPIWTKNVVETLGGFNESFERLQDVEFHTRAIMQECSFQVSKSSEPDCFYRISEQRNTGRKEELIQSKWKGIVSYFNYFTIEGKGLRYLNGTLLEGVKLVLQNDGDVTWLRDQLTELARKNKHVNLNLIKIYILLYKIGFYRIKGFNFLFKNTLIGL